MSAVDRTLTGLSRVCLAAIIALWLGVLLHEAGHFLPSLLLFPSGDPAQASRLARLIVYSGGPIVTLLLLAWSCWSSARYDRTPPSAGRLTFVIALGLGAASRAILLTPTARLVSWRGDETALASVTGFSKWAFLLPEFVVAVAATIWLLAHVPMPRARMIAALIAGIVAGWVSVIYVGPKLGLPI